MMRYYNLSNDLKKASNIFRRHGAIRVADVAWIWKFLHVAFGVYAHAVHTVLADKVLYRLEFNDPCLKGFSRFTTTTEELFKPIVDVISKVVNTVNAKEVLTDA